MVKKIIGIIAALAIVALVVMTALGAGSYKSMLPEDLFSGSSQSDMEQVVEQTEATTTDAEPSAE